ncbi:hypothetical protein ACN20G_12825 [Streptomyces sp. BI20]|uniref:hypothetical protein n=1 Tax=Streptomyces sp. BI20 TaxID=3403460 RepID=UPI003C7716C5
MSPQEPQHPHQTRGYSVPSGRPYALKELHAGLNVVGDMAKELYDGAHPAEYEAISDALYTTFRAAAGLAPAKSHTGCAEHPDGALDPEPPEGWGLCLICNDRRRRHLRETGRRTAPITRTRAEERRLGYPVPPPPYTLDGLRAQLARLEEGRFHLTVASPEQEFARVADDLHRAFIVARELSRARTASGCPEHPGAPTDPTAPPGEDCIFCAGRKRRAQRPEDVPDMLPRIRRGERRQLQRRFERPPG